MEITPEQTEIGKDNFHEAVGFTRRDILKTAAVGGVGLEPCISTTKNSMARLFEPHSLVAAMKPMC